MNDHETDRFGVVHHVDIPTTSSRVEDERVLDVECSADEGALLHASCSEIEVETEPGTSEEDLDLKPPILEREEPTISDEASPPVEHHPENTIMISPDDVIEAGLDPNNLNNLTNEQISMLLDIAERRAQRDMDVQQGSMSSQQQIDDVVEENYEGDDVGVPMNNYNEALTMVITDDGSLKLTDACNQIFYFSSEQLGSMNIDVNNLTDESIQQIVQYAMPAIQVGKPQQAQPEDHHVIYDEHEHDVFQHGMQPSSSRVKSPSVVRASQLIGEQVEVRRNGKTIPATVRYVRNGGALKIQFDDGHFEWVTEEQIIFRQPRLHSDHEGYHNGASTSAMTRVVHSMAGMKRAAAVGGGCNDAKRANMEPNFCCPICEQKVYQKEPVYIVVRIPACEACTKEKIMVIDDRHDEDDQAVL